MQIEGRYFLAMEYIHGEDVRSIYNQAFRLQRSLPLSHSVQVIADAARGLAHAHRAKDLAGQPLGLVHRDVSPQNILVTFEGHVKVVDFGIAKAANKVEQTRSGVLKGKYSYMSPEQALGDSVDHRTDLFALGIVLFETTTGTRLFKRATELTTLQAIIKCDHPRPSEALPGYPPGLETIVLKTLKRHPADRYRDGDRLADALEDFLDDARLRSSRETIADFMADLFKDRLREEAHTGDLAAARRGSRAHSLPAYPPEEDLTAPPLPQARVATEVGSRKRPALGRVAEDLELTQSDEQPPVPSDPAADAMPSVTDRAPDEDEQTAAVTSAWDAPEKTRLIRDPHSEGAFSDWTQRLLMQRKPSDSGEEFDEDLVVPRDRVQYVVLAVAAVLLGLVLGLGGALWRSGGPTKAEVTVLTEPGAEVFVDGDALGPAGPEGRAGPFLLPEGSRLIRVVQAELRFERERSVEVTAGRTYETEIRARKGFLQLRVSPWAQVAVDGKAMGLTPLPRIPLYEGVHEVVLVNPDMKARRVVTARVLAGEETKVEMRLTEGENGRQ
ncbi:MAG: serine/threonine-protein kinase [Myxococcota bacterium]